DADLATMSPAHLPIERLERIDEGAQERRLALTVVAQHRRPRAMLDLDLDIGGDLALGIADHEVAAADRRASARVDARRPDPGHGLVAGDLDQLQALELFPLGACQRGRRR